MLKAAGGEGGDEGAKKTCHMLLRGTPKSCHMMLEFIFYEQEVSPTATFIAKAAEKCIFIVSSNMLR